MPSSPASPIVRASPYSEPSILRHRPLLVLLGETRSRRNLAVLQARSWGRIFLYRRPTPYPFEPWAFDNGAFGAFCRKQPFPEVEFLRRLEIATGPRTLSDPIFGVLPDIVAGGCTSLQFSAAWFTKLQGIDWPWYLAVQDGMTIEDVRPFCRSVSGLFLGGTTEFKSTAPEWARLAHSNQIRFHYGRASTPAKLSHAFHSGADSCDTAFPLWTQTRMDAFQAQYDSLHKEFLS